jgi:hypothetical protein
MIDWFVGYALRKRLVVAMLRLRLDLRRLLLDATCNRSLSGHCRYEFASYYQAPGMTAEEVEAGARQTPEPSA